MKIKRIIKPSLSGLTLNLVYCIYNGFIGIFSHSWWFITICAYYTVLSVMRFAVLQIKQTQNSKYLNEQFIKRFTGIMFIILSITLIGTVLLSFTDNRGIKYHEIVMITIALYTFSKVTVAIVNMIKAKKADLPLLKTLRNISFVDAFVSIFSLQRSMLVSFQGMSEANIKLFNLLTGSAVCIFVFLSGINLIGGKRITMAKSKIIKANEKITETAVDGYKKIEKGVVDGYKKIEDGVVKGYTKIEDSFVKKYLIHDNETVEEAKKRLKK